MAAAGLAGLAVGSFLNVVIYRLPLMLEREWREQCAALAADGTADGAADGAADGSTDGARAGSTATAEPEPPFNLVTPRSACPACRTPIKPWHNLPVLGWFILGGRCAACRAPISVRYPLIEALTGLLSALVVWHFGATPEAMGALVVTWSLVALTVIDLDHQLLPDVITLPLLWAGLLFHLWQGEPAPGSPFGGLADGVAGAVAGYLSLWLLYHGFRLLTGKEGMGYGDFKLFAALGAWLGWQALPLVILLSAATGAVVGIGLIVLARHGRETPIPFGPYLAAAGFVALLWGQDLTDAYLRFAFG